MVVQQQMSDLPIHRTTTDAERAALRQQFENASDGPRAAIAISFPASINPTSTMRAPATFLVLTAILAAIWINEARADQKTVCSITVNSADESEAFRRHLPPDKFRFVELVERGRADWLESACRQGVRCDVLVISGHYDGGNEFFSDRLDAREFLPVNEMERVSCSNSCPGLFSQLKEVYLFGCNTLNPEPLTFASAEIGRSLVRSGHSQADANRLARELSTRHGDSSRDRMRQIFMNVPVIYGFSSVAPLGPTAASILNRHFQTAGTGDVGSGRASGKMLGAFGSHSMVVASGLSDQAPQAAYRREVCQFSDDRLSPAQKLAFVHRLLNRDMAEVRMFLGRIERYAASLSETERQDSAVAAALDEIAHDQAARVRFLDFARDADQPAIRVRMIELAGELGWLSAADQRAEFMQLIDDRLARKSMSAGDVDLACTLNKDHALDEESDRLQLSSAQYDEVTHAAVLACLGSAAGHAKVLEALTSPDPEQVRIAQAYLRHRPIADANELRDVANRIAGMSASDAQVRALDALAQNPVSDRESLEALTRLFPVARSAGVQTAIAGVLIRSDYQAIATPELVQSLRQSRLRPPLGEDLIDVLIRRLQAHLALAGV